jgi:hypothetical protein
VWEVGKKPNHTNLTPALTALGSTRLTPLRTRHKPHKCAVFRAKALMQDRQHPVKTLMQIVRYGS